MTNAPSNKHLQFGTRDPNAGLGGTGLAGRGQRLLVTRCSHGGFAVHPEPCPIYTPPLRHHLFIIRRRIMEDRESIVPKFSISEEQKARLIWLSEIWTTCIASSALARSSSFANSPHRRSTASWGSYRCWLHATRRSIISTPPWRCCPSLSARASRQGACRRRRPFTWPRGSRPAGSL